MNKKSPVFMMSILVLGLAMSATAQVDPSLVGWWRLDDGTGTTATDSSGNGNNGEFVGAPTWVPGLIGQAVHFDGDNDWIEVPHNDILTVDNEVTVAAWVLPEQLDDGGSGYQGVITKGNAVRSYSLYTTTNGTMHFSTTSGGAYAGSTSSGVVVLNEWQHLSAQVKGGVHHYYINGLPAGTGSSGVNLPGTADGDAVRIGNSHEGSGRRFGGTIDDVRIYNRALEEAEYAAVMKGSLPTVAANPYPANDDNDALRDSILTWEPGIYDATHNVYFGTSIEEIASATAPTAAGLTVTSFDPGRLEFGQTYYWRVDEVNVTPDKTVYEGDVWTFTAEPYSIQIPTSEITVTASSFSNEFSTSEKAIDGSGLGADDTHATSAETMWFTASPDMDPWIQFEFDDIKQLDTMKVWNSNSTAEIAIGWGVKDVVVEYSVDGENWVALEGASQFNRAPGLPTYNQYDEIAFNGVPAKVVRLDIASNWGGILMSYSLGEVQFNMIPAQARTPVPASGATDVLPNAILTWRAGREAGQHTIYASTDENAVADGSAPSVTSSTNSLDLTPLDLQMSETYYWRVDEVNEAEATTVWAGPVWSLSTAASLIVEDFESYGNLSPNRPFQAWLDGFGYSSDEFFTTGYGGNGTGAGIGHDIWSLSSPHYDGDLMETTSTILGSGQSMPFYYSNTGGVASQTERTFAGPQDWTVGAAQTLSIAFRGQSGNTGTLYVMINNAKVTYPHDAANIAVGAWQAWNIDLSSVNTNLQSITKLVIGVDGNGAAGMLLIDDITLHAEAGELITPVDPGTNGLVALYTFEGNFNDSSGNGHNGTVVGLNGTEVVQDPTRGQVLSLPGGEDQFVEIGAVGISGTMPRTIACWAKADNTAITDWTLIFGFTGQADATGGNGSHFNIGSLGGPGGIGAHCWGWEETMISDQEGLDWHHYAMTYDGTTIAYFLDGAEIDSDPAKSNVQDLSTSGDRVHIGSRVTQTSSFPGNVDDAAIYDRVLSAEEILWMAGVTTPIDKPF